MMMMMMMTITVIVGAVAYKNIA